VLVALLRSLGVQQALAASLNLPETVFEIRPEFEPEWCVVS
jgi:hypothetical protein